MATKQIYNRMTADSMTSHPTAAAIGNSLIMMDNLDGEVILPDEEKMRFMRNPIQFVSTMTILVCVRGWITVNIGLQSYRMETGDSLFLKSGLIAELTDMGDDDTIKFFSIILNEEFYIPIFNNMDLSVLQRVLIRNPICRLTEQSITECITTYRLIKNRLQTLTDSDLQYEIVKGYLQAILFTVYSHYLDAEKVHRSEGQHPTRQQDLFNRFMELLQRDYRQEHSIKYYASQLCVTPSYLSRVVYEESGHYASEHIDNFLITEAKQLVRSRQYTISQISDMLNFTCQSFFGRYFKKFTGYSPTQYQALG